MMLKLHDSEIFTTDPAIRFARRYGVKQHIWLDVWKRHLSGSEDDECLAGYILYKTGKRISVRTLRRWLARGEIYCRATHIIHMGVRVVRSEYFGVYEPFIIDEVLNNMKYAGMKDSRILL